MRILLEPKQYERLIELAEESKMSTRELGKKIISDYLNKK